MSRNCMNCGAPIDKDVCKCQYCGTLYYDLTAFESGRPCYVKFRTPTGVLTSLAIPEITEINLYQDTIDTVNYIGKPISRFIRSYNCDINVSFRAIEDVEDKSMVKFEYGD